MYNQWILPSPYTEYTCWLRVNIFFQLDGLFCGEKKEKDLEFHPIVYFLDGMEGNE